MSDVPDVDCALRLLEAVRSALRAAGDPIQRVAVEAVGVNPLSWLQRRRGGDRRYWRGRDDGVTIASVGHAAGVEVSDLQNGAAAIREFVASLPSGGSAIGTARFDCSGEAAAEWAAFGRVCFSVPRVECRVGDGGSTLAAYLTDEDKERPDETLRGLEETLLYDQVVPANGRPSAPPASAPRADSPVMADWDRTVRRALDAFTAGRMEKVVLARRSTWPLRHLLDPIDAIVFAAAAAPGCFHVVVEKDDVAFVCVSPERLLRLEHGRIITEAVAGTSANGSGAFSSKDRLEHQVVVDDVRARLKPLLETVEMDDAPGELALLRRTHLRTAIAGRPRESRDALDVLAELHPTPAVGGAPRNEALPFIGGAEPFDRGLYAGFVGRIGRDGRGAMEAEFAVGIRSALITRAEVHLFAGAGIVPGSDPQAEWDEVEGKMSDLASALGLP